ncbi:MAG TPA: LysR substrate-binding domain-containing protein, partial [Burkholderiaceae bacterium]|nr:LysR substrate-binding domain-containing protein [Burkholderiaceae bacterium]
MSETPSQAPPPLNALRAFEAAARHSNFARAALELNVTTGALSHQIRGLEALLGVQLFERLARGVALTPPGRVLYPGLASGFGQIREAVAALRASASSNVLVVSTPPGFTSKWLAPRLYRFAHEHPEVELRVASSAAYANFANDGVDVAVRSIPQGGRANATLASEKLTDDWMIAVCSPALLAKVSGPQGRAASRESLRRIMATLPLIHDDQLAGRPEVPTWADWFRTAGLAAPDLRRGLRFSSADHAIEAAVQGAGLLLTHALLAHDELASGRLAMPLSVVLPGGRTYYLVRPKAPPRPALEAFRVWLKREMAATRGAGVTQR